MKIFRSFAIVFALFGVAACTDPATSNRVLSAQGYTDIAITGYRFTGCGADDSQATGFEATAPDGKTHVTGVVCSNWGPFGKSSTVRVD